MQGSTLNDAGLSVVIVNYNAGAMLSRVLDCLDRQTVRPEEVIILDNGSTDGSLPTARREHPGHAYVELGCNLGFAKANNIGAARATQPWLATLNPDAFPAPDWVEQIKCGIARHPRTASFATIMVCDHNPDVVDSAGIAYQETGMAWGLFEGAPLRNLPDSDIEVFGASAGAAVYDRTVFLELGGFDEDLFCYYEDVDLALRLRLRSEICVLLTAAVVRHVGSAIAGVGSPFSVYQAHRNMVWVFFKTMPAGLLVRNLARHALVNAISVAVFVRKGHWRTILRAKRDALLGLPRSVRKRTGVQAGTTRDQFAQTLERKPPLFVTLRKVLGGLEGRR